MVKQGLQKNLLFIIDEADKFGRRPVYEVLMDIFYKKKSAGVSVFRGVAGYGSDGILHKSKILDLSASLPLKIEAVDFEKMLNSFMPDVLSIVEKGFIEISDTTVLKCCQRKDN